MTDKVNSPYLLAIILVISGNGGVHLVWFLKTFCVVKLCFLYPVNANIVHTWSPGGLVMPGHQHLLLSSVSLLSLLLLLIFSVF